MRDKFHSARRKLGRAKKHLSDLERKIDSFGNKKHLYDLFSEPDPQNLQHVSLKMRLAKELPGILSDITGDVVANLRAALDHAMYAVAIAGGCASPKYAYFPFSGDAAHFESNLKGSCKDVPKEIYPLLRSYQPYKGGSDALYALNVLCNSDKHAIIVPMGTVTISTSVSVSGTGFFNMPQPHIWDREKNEMVLITLAAGSKYHAEFEFGLFVAFGEIDIVRNKPVIPNLHLFANIVETIIGEIDAECRKLGLIS